MSVEIREPKQDEAGQIADLLNEHAQKAFGETDVAEAEVRHWFGMPNIWIRVAERNGRLVDRTITFLEDAEGLRLIDGNKRAVAIYEAAVSAMPLSFVVLVPAARTGDPRGPAGGRSRSESQPALRTHRNQESLI